MAFSGMHIVFGYAGSNTNRNTGAELLTPVASENLTSAGTTTKAAPPASGALGQPMVQLRAAADSWASIGPNPNAANDTVVRVLVPAGQPVEVYCNPGDRVAWASA